MSESKIKNLKNMNTRNVFTIECKDIILKEFELEDLDEIYALTLQHEIIGWCCSGLKDELPLPNREIGYAISKNYRNKGYTTQAAQGLIKYLFENTNLEVLNVTALTYNKPSNRVIEKCGFNFISNIEIENQEFYYYKISKKQWENKFF